MFMFRDRQPALDVAIEDPATRVRTYLDARVARSIAPGLQYVVVDSSGVRIDYAGGWADIGGGRPMDLRTSMMAYSMSKTITAAAVLTLVAAGRVGLDDAAERYVPDIPYGAGVTIRGLLSHTAGIPNPMPLAWVHPAETHETFDERSASGRPPVLSVGSTRTP
jgi:CubicO group peptidase (beta-lactamase class C family)